MEEKLERTVADSEELELEAIDLEGIDILEDDLVPCSCCGDSCNCND
jgi:hypothetical protein